MSGVLLAAVGNSYGYKPINTVAPAITGTAQARQTLTCSTGTWNAAPLPITYTYQWKKNGSNISGATSSTYVVLSADVGSTIRCTVTATNAVGATSADSNTTATVIANVPAAPTIGTATATGSSTATVAFTPPADNGGATITSYTAVSSPGGITATGSSSPITVTGLLPSTSYTFRVYATNSVGNSALSNASNSITTQEAYWIALTNDYATNGVGIVPSGTGVIVGGGKYDYSFSPPHAVFRAYRLNSAGNNETFSKQFGGNYTTSAGLYSGSSGASYNSGFYVGASSTGLSPKQAYAVGIDSSGNLSLNIGRTHASQDTDCEHMTFDSSGNRYLGASIYDAYTGTRTAGVVKYDSSNNFQWQRVGQTSNYSSPKGIGATTTRIVVPYSRQSWSGLYALNGDGTLAFDKGTYNPDGNSGGTGVINAIVDSSNNAYVLFSGNFAGYDGVLAIAKFNSSGTIQWVISSYPSYRAGPTAWLNLASDGFIYLISRDQTAPGSVNITKLNTSGSIQWDRRLYHSSTTLNAGTTCAVVGSSLYVPFRYPSNAAILKVPTDGSRTGTYGDYTYTTGAIGWTSTGLSGYQGPSGIYTPTTSAASSSAGSANFSLSITKVNL